MNAVAPVSRQVSLELCPGDLRRHLILQLGTAHLTARVLAPGNQRKHQRQQTLVFASDELVSCRLEVQRSASCLWIGRTAFDLTSEETQIVRTVFEMHGLQVRVP